MHRNYYYYRPSSSATLGSQRRDIFSLFSSEFDDPFQFSGFSSLFSTGHRRAPSGVPVGRIVVEDGRGAGLEDRRRVEPPRKIPISGEISESRRRPRSWHLQENEEQHARPLPHLRPGANQEDGRIVPVDVTLIARLPNGDMVFKFFDGTTKLETVYAWILEEMAARNLEIHQFDLSCAFPTDRKPWSSSSTLVDAGLYPRALLNVTPM